jgi:RimK-like ATP-grasp domain
VTGKGTILLWGLSIDPPLAVVRDALKRMGCRVMLLDQRDVLDTEVDFVVGSSVEGRLRAGQNTIKLNEVKAVYPRPYDLSDLPAIASSGPGSEAWQHALAVQDILNSWTEITPALVVNRPAVAEANGSKPYQSLWIESLGFRIPETLITTDPDVAVEFWKQHERVIYKSLSGVRSIVSRVTDEHIARSADVASCPTQFQHYVPGIDYRVHLVGDEVFACRILSDADDYRLSNSRVEMQSCELPEEINALCRSLVMSMDLLVAGVDLRCTPDGDWYCFEVNPSPGFTYFQGRTGQPIADAVARLLGSAPD